MLPNASSSLISTLGWVLPVLGVVAYFLITPTVRRALSKKIHEGSAYFFHPSERSTTATAAEDPTSARAHSERSPLDQIKPAGWDYDFYASATPVTDTESHPGH